MEELCANSPRHGGRRRDARNENENENENGGEKKKITPDFNYILYILHRKIPSFVE